MLAGLRQDQLAEKLGVSEATVSNWETGKYLPRRKQLLNLARLFPEWDGKEPKR